MTTTRWLDPVGRMALVGAAAAAALSAPSLLGGPAAGLRDAAPASDIPASLATLVCPGDPFSTDLLDASAAEGDDPGQGAEPRDQSVEAGTALTATAPDEAMDGLVDRSDAPASVRLGEGPEPDEAEALAELPDGFLTARASGPAAPGFVASQGLRATGEDATGVAATPCGPPAADLWFVSGGGEPGRQERLLLSNPGSSPVSIDLTVLPGASADSAEQGATDTTGTEGTGSDDTGSDDAASEDAASEDTGPDAATSTVVVPAGERRSVLLDGLAGTTAAQVVHLQSSGGVVSAAITDEWLEGVDPAGVEVSGPTSAPAQRLVVPANVNGSARGAVIGAPGEEDAVVEIRSLGEGGSTSVEVVTVPAGSSVEVDLPTIDGLHSWALDADVPVVAASWTAVGSPSEGTGDVSWSVATPPVERLGGAALPPSLSDGSQMRVAVASAEATSVEVVTVRDGAVSTQTIELQADHGGIVEVEEGASAVWVRPDGAAVHAAAMISRPGGLTSVPLMPTPVSVRSVPVTPQP